MDSRVVDVAIGMVFTFAVVAALAAVLSELVARALGLRARYLLLGLRELLDDRTVTEVRLANTPTRSPGSPTGPRSPKPGGSGPPRPLSSPRTWPTGTSGPSRPAGTRHSPTWCAPGG